ncbi:MULTISPECIES: alpha/beta hydrolase [Bacillaceae]|uniref:alpha/beta hydrolase n=1 Tax=Bacillaceae TaxID=186817 RepID=UPI001E43DE87|nr:MULTISPECIES: alpha/beta hydrolase-fold protein [Bacillaceae]MCE4048591.1 alpha/beta hydrolase [Bacillus sp. Au-Bac7]MCM3032127.1 alpha/beta hydrolase-fold protein [Niallia sp. MER 6]
MEELIEKTVGGRKLYICLPPSYYQTDQHYPAVYVHDGHYLFSSNLAKLKESYQVNEIKEVILIGMEPVDRLHEYTPWPAESLVPAFPDFKGEGKEYLHTWEESIKAYIDSQFRTIPDMKETGMLGASLGGLITLFALFSTSEVIGKYGLLSPSLWFPNMLEFLENEECSPEKKKLYLYVGSEEGKGKTNIQQEMVQSVQNANGILERKGFSQQQLLFEVRQAANHQREYFIEQFMVALRWLYKK